MQNYIEQDYRVVYGVEKLITGQFFKTKKNDLDMPPSHFVSQN